MLHGLLSGCREQGLLWLRCRGFPLRWLLLDVGSRARELQCCAHGLSCAAAHGVFLDQEEKLCLLLWPVDSLPLIPTIMFKLVLSRKTLDFFLVSSDLAALLLATGRIRRPSPLFRWAVDPLICHRPSAHFSHPSTCPASVAIFHQGARASSETCNASLPLLGRCEQLGDQCLGPLMHLGCLLFAGIIFTGKSVLSP